MDHLDRRRLIGIALVVVSACGFGSGALFAKPVYGAGVDWLALLAWRFLFGALFSWGWLVASRDRRASLRRLSGRAVAVSLGLGILYVGNSAAYFAGLETVPASLAALIVYIYPALVAVLTLRFGQPLAGRRAWSALGLATLGVMLAVGGIDPATRPPLTGLVLMIASPIIYSVWIIISARLAGERSDRVGHETEEGAGPAAASAFMTTATAVAFWGLALSTRHPVLPGAIPGAAWPGLLGVGFASTFLAIQAFYAGTRRMGAAQAALVSTVEPIWTITLAAMLFGESLTPVQLAGGALIIAGVLLAQSAPDSALRAARPAVRIADE